MTVLLLRITRQRLLLPRITSSDSKNRKNGVLRNLPCFNPSTYINTKNLRRISTRRTYIKREEPPSNINTKNLLRISTTNDLLVSADALIFTVPHPSSLSPIPDWGPQSPRGLAPSSHTAGHHALVPRPRPQSSRGLAPSSHTAGHHALVPTLPSPVPAGPHALVPHTAGLPRPRPTPSPPVPAEHHSPKPNSPYDLLSPLFFSFTTSSWEQSQRITHVSSAHLYSIFSLSSHLFMTVSSTRIFGASSTCIFCASSTHLSTHLQNTV